MFYRLFRRAFQIGIIFTLAGCLTIPAVAQSTVASPTPQRKSSTPYKGDLSIFESPDRDKKLQVERVMGILGIHPGSSVADIGAGSGWFTVRAAKRAGEQGLVYAVDINPDAIDYINNRIRRENIHNVRTVLGAADDPRLPQNSIDCVLILKTYHEIAEPVRLLQNLRKSLKPGARVGIIDRNGTGEDHGIQQSIVEDEAEHAGYHLIEQYDFVKSDREDYFLVFQVK
jgi:ubiquinone/menaquinone biosynthesis C-methylase UbiE